MVEFSYADNDTSRELYNLLDFVKEHFGRNAPHAKTVSYVGKDMSLNYSVAVTRCGSIESFPCEIMPNPV